MIVLTLPAPVSANRYWKTAVRAGRAITYVSGEAQAYREEVARIVASRGIREPLRGRVELAIQLYPNQPKDWASRVRKLGQAWDDSVMCLDLDNANKVLLDSIKGLVIEDDRWVRKITSERMVPDEKGARVVLFVRPMAIEVQPDLLEAA
jgi:crossover junction endodeoxyribonuclease RusA